MGLVAEEMLGRVIVEGKLYEILLSCIHLFVNRMAKRKMLRKIRIAALTHGDITEMYLSQT